MKWMRTAVLTVAVAVLSWGPSARPVRVGTFDSRALAVAYAPSAHFKAWLRALPEVGGEELAVARQARMHQQAFSTLPVDDILAVIAAELPRVAAEAEVDVLVSRWRLAYRSEGVEFVDVTDSLVELFEPNEKTLQHVREIREADPLPLFDTDWEELEKH